MNLVSLFRFYLRRHRLLFFAVLMFVFLHDLAFLSIFQFWKQQTQFSSWLLSVIPDRVREGVGVPLNDLTDPLTYKAIVLMRPDFRVLTLLFGVAVGTDVIAGEVGRGTADLLFSHPVRRATAVLAGALTIFAHLVCLGAVSVFGFKLGALIFPMGAREPTLAQLFPSVAAAMIASFAIAMTALLCGSLCATRGRAVGLTLLCVLGPLVLDFMSIFVSGLGAVAHVFPEHYYRPHMILFGLDDPSLGEIALASCAIGGLLLAGAMFFAERRDLVR